MKDRPILFSQPMILALRAGCKTTTRRIIKPQPYNGEDLQIKAAHVGGDCWRLGCLAHMGVGDTWNVRYAAGDRLWVREAWSVKRHEPCQEHERDWQSLHGPVIRFAADAEEIKFEGNKRSGLGIYHGPVETKKPSIHMPRWASRLTLIVESVKVERLQDISREDAEAEGVEWESADPPFYYVPGIFPHSLTAVGVEEPGRLPHAVRSYAKLWSIINGAGSWESNPWVVAPVFSVHHCNIDKMDAAK
jgi:hypothetical protein